MCFQGFAYFACGHSRIVASNCEYADTIDHPFFIATACPDYRSTSERPQWYCGTGRFYCKDLPDGSGVFLDGQYQIRQEAQDAIINIDEQLGKATMALRQIVQSGKQQGVPDHLIRQHPKFRGIQGYGQQLTQQRLVQVKIGQQATDFISDARTHFARIGNGKSGTAGGSVMPPFVPSAGKMPAELMPTHPQQPAQATTPFPPRSRLPPHLIQRPQLPSPAGSSIDAAPRTLPSQRSFAETHGSTTMGPGLRALVGESSAVEKMQPPSTKKQGRGQKGGRRKAAVADLADEDFIETDTVRRSTRTRGKQVNYAESVASSAASREPSPMKSDVSGFSPAKSDESSGSEPRRSSRRSESAQLHDEVRRLRPEPLREKISKWNKTGSAARTSSRSPQRREMPGMKDILNTSPAAQESFDRQATTSSPDAIKPMPTQSAPAFVPPRIPLSSSDVPQPMTGAQQALAVPGLPLSSSDIPHSMTGTHQARAVPGMPPYQGRSSFSGAIPNTQATNLFTGYRNFNRPSTSPAMTTPSVLAQTPFQQMRYSSPYGPQAHSLQHSLLASGAPANFRRESVLSRSQNPSPEAYAQSQLNYTAGTEPWMQRQQSYDDLRRSFGSAADLPPTMAAQQTPECVEPRKRALASSSPQEESAKRMRLSLPGEAFVPAVSDGDDEDWMLGRTVRANTPLQPVQQFSRSQTETTQPGTTVPAPAPVFAPEAVMTQRDSSKTLAAALTEAAEANELPLQHFPGFESGGAGEDHGLDFSDNIDWLVEDDELDELP